MPGGRTTKASPKDPTSKCYTLDDVMAAIKEVKEDLGGQIQDLTRTVEFVSKKYDDLLQEVKELREEKIHQNKKIDELEGKNIFLHDALEKATIEIRDITQYMRNKNIVIHGIEYEQNEDLHAIITLAKKMNLPVDIDVMHRLPSKKGIIIQFHSRTSRDLWLEHRRTKLESKDIIRTGSSSKVFINEHLSPYCQELFQSTKTFASSFRFKFCWFRNGKVYLRKNEGDKDALIIKSIKDLDKIRKELSTTSIKSV